MGHQRAGRGGGRWGLGGGVPAPTRFPGGPCAGAEGGYAGGRAPGPLGFFSNHEDTEVFRMALGGALKGQVYERNIPKPNKITGKR